MPDNILFSVEEKMEGALDSLRRELSKVRTGRANPKVLDIIFVDYYGAKTPIPQMANISVPEAQQLLIKPYDKSMLREIESAISAANIGVNPNNDGECIRLIFPPLTEERRREFVKLTKATGENIKVAVRNARRDGIDAIKKLELPEDESKGYQDEIQTLTDAFNKKVDAIVDEKEAELMKI